MWKCKRCGEEVVGIETINETTTYKLTKNQKKKKIIDRNLGTWEIGYICSNLDCENNEEYSKFLSDIAEWEDR